jgi:hypothetical protein
LKGGIETVWAARSTIKINTRVGCQFFGATITDEAFLMPDLSRVFYKPAFVA